MEISMRDGRVMMSIGSVTVPLTSLPLEEWRVGEDVIDHPSLRLWEADCMKNMRESD
jgi:hypothetical protein